MMPHRHPPTDINLEHWTPVAAPDVLDQMRQFLEMQAVTQITYDRRILTIRAGHRVVKLAAHGGDLLTISGTDDAPDRAQRTQG